MKTDELVRIERSVTQYARMLEKMADICEELHTQQKENNAVSSLLIKQLKELGRVVRENVSMCISGDDIPNEMEKKIVADMEKQGVQIERIEQSHLQSFRRRWNITMRNVYKQSMTINDVAGILSDALQVRMHPVDNCRTVLNSNWNQYTFEEKEHFQVIYGVAKRSKYPESRSGDNFYIEKLDDGKLIIGIADGMGTGQKAWERSRLVIELIIDAIKVGFTVKNAIELINMIYASNDQSGDPVTLDLCIIDTQNGIADFVKLGAVATFIRRSEWIEMIQSETMPMGVLEQVDFDYTTKKLYAKDYIIMITDGVLDSLSGLDKEEQFLEIIEGIKTQNPRSMAEQIMECVGQNFANDDMMILVAGIYE